MSALRLWTWFIRFRIFIFTLCAVISLACSMTFGALLLREWEFYDIVQRSVVLALTIIHGVGAILLYLMIVVRFRIWLDVARVSFYLFSLLGGNTFFAVVNATYPCNNFGSYDLCRHVTWSVIIGGWVQSGFLIVYSVFLAVASHARPSTRPQVIVSPPPPIDNRVNEKSSVFRSRRGSVDSLASTTGLLSYTDKRSNMGSMDSFGSSSGTKSLLQVPDAVPVMFPAVPQPSKGYGWGSSIQPPMPSYTERPRSPAASVQSSPPTFGVQQPACHYPQGGLQAIRPLHSPYIRRNSSNPFRVLSPPEYSASLPKVSVRPLPLPNPFESMAVSRSPSAKSVPYSATSNGSFDTVSSMYASSSGFVNVPPRVTSPSPWTPTTTEYLSAHKENQNYPSVTMFDAKYAWGSNGAALLMSPGLRSIHSMSGSTYSRLPESKQTLYNNGWSVSPSLL